MAGGGLPGENFGQREMVDAIKELEAALKKVDSLSSFSICCAAEEPCSHIWSFFVVLRSHTTLYSLYHVSAPRGAQHSPAQERELLAEKRTALANDAGKKSQLAEQLRDMQTKVDGMDREAQARKQLLVENYATQVGEELSSCWWRVTRPRWEKSYPAVGGELRDPGGRRVIRPRWAGGP